MKVLLKRLKDLGKHRLSRRALPVACGVWCALMLLPLILISFDAHPTHDDFVHSLTVTEAWLRTGSLWAALGAAWDRALFMYHNWQGTFVAMFFSALQPMVFSPRLFFLTPLLTLGGLCLSAAYFSKNLIRRTLGAGAPASAVFFTVLMTLLLQFLPSAREVIYWHSGTPYALSVMMILVILGLLLKLHRQAFSLSYALRGGLLFACGVVLGGCPYPLALGGALGLCFVAAWALWTRSAARWGSLCALAGTGLALALVVAAPGNLLRQEVVGAPVSAARAVVQSVAECAEMTGQWFSPQLVAAAVLLLPLLAPALRACGFSFGHPFLFMTLSFGVLAASFVPPIYATGLEGYRVERVLSSLYMLYALLALLNLLYLGGYLLRRLERPSACLETLGRKGPSLAVLSLCGMLLLWGLFANAIMTAPSIAAAKSLLTGEAARYHQEMSLREERLAASETKAEAVSAIVPLSAEPVALPVDKLPFQREGGMPGLMRRYFRLHQLAGIHGPGKIPPGEWEALDSWPAR